MHTHNHRDSVFCSSNLCKLSPSSVEHPLPVGDQHWNGSDGVGLLCGVLCQGLLPYRGEGGGRGRGGREREINEKLREGWEGRRGQVEGTRLGVY